MIPAGDLKRQYTQMKNDIDTAIRGVFKSGWFILGEQVELFEKEFARYCGSKYAVGVGSGTEALHLSLVSLGIGTGDEVITVANTAVFTVSAISFAGARPVFVDIDPKYYTMDAKQIERHITKRTKAIMPVHLYGQCADMAVIRQISGKYDLRVIEDACQAHGAEFEGKKAGAMGDLGCFSFYPSKNLGGYGDGGIITTNSLVLADRLRLLRNGGQKLRYHHIVKGFNSRLDEIQAAVLRVKLLKLDRLNRRRMEIAATFDKRIMNDLIQKPECNEKGRHVYHLYVIRCKQRDALQEYLNKHGIQTLIHYPIPVHRQIAYSESKMPRGALPVTEKYAKQILTLPLFPEMSKKEIDKIIRIINAFKG